MGGLPTSASPTAQKARIQPSFDWDYRYCYDSYDLYNTILFRSATSLLCQHCFRISTLGHPRWNACSGNDALDRGIEHESEFHHHDYRDWS